MHKKKKSFICVDRSCSINYRELMEQYWEFFGYEIRSVTNIDPELEHLGPTKYALQNIVLWKHPDQSGDGYNSPDYPSRFEVYQYLKKKRALSDCLKLADLVAIKRKGLKHFQKSFRDYTLYAMGSAYAIQLQDMPGVRSGKLQSEATFVPSLMLCHGSLLISFEPIQGGWSGMTFGPWDVCALFNSVDKKKLVEKREEKQKAKRTRTNTEGRQQSMEEWEEEGHHVVGRSGNYDIVTVPVEPSTTFGFSQVYYCKRAKTTIWG